MADVDMTDAPASADVAKKDTAVETKGKKGDGKPRFEVKKVRALCSFVWSWPCLR